MSTTTTLSELAGRLSGWVERLPPQDDRFARLRRDLDAAFSADHRPLDPDSVRDVDDVVRRSARHLTFDLDPAGALQVDDHAPGWPPVPRAEVDRRAAWVSSVRRDADGTGVLRVDNLDPHEHAAPYLEAAFALLRGCRGLVLDLRGNGGGDPATLALLVEFVRGPRSEHLSDVRYRNTVRQWWTRPRPQSASLDPDAAVAVLVGPATYSSGEALAYHLQTLGAATVIGSPTAGASDHVTPVVLTPHVRALVPEATVTDPRTGSSWEETGVVPDVVTDDPEAAAAELLASR